MAPNVKLHRAKDQEGTELKDINGYWAIIS